MPPDNIMSLGFATAYRRQRHELSLRAWRADGHADIILCELSAKPMHMPATERTASPECPKMHIDREMYDADGAGQAVDAR